jgi:hypothetical protein
MNLYQPLADIFIPDGLPPGIHYPLPRTLSRRRSARAHSLTPILIMELILKPAWQKDGGQDAAGRK